MGTLSIRSAKFMPALEKVFAVLALLLFTGAFLGLLGGGEAQDSNRLAQVSYLGVYGITFLLVAVRLDRFVYLSTREPLLLILVGIAVISILWSVAPEVTLRRSFALLGTTLFGAYLAMRFSLREQLRLLAWTLCIAALLSIVFALALPHYGVMSDARGEALRGIYNHKNVLGRLMTISAMALLLLALSVRRYRWLTWGGFGLSLSLLLLSGAKTALVILATLLILVPCYRALRGTFTIVIPVVITIVLVAASAFVYSLGHVDTMLAVLDRDVTLTGRTEIWSTVLDMIAARPWLGYGYGAFWLGWEGESAQVWITLSAFAANLYPNHAHNGVLDLWLELGFVGVVVFALLFLVTIIRTLRLIRSTEAIESAWPLLYLTSLLLNSITYPIGLERNSIWWVLLVAIVISLAAQASQIRKGHLYELDGMYDEKPWSKGG